MENDNPMALAPAFNRCPLQKHVYFFQYSVLNSVFSRRVSSCQTGQDNEKTVYNTEDLLNELKMYRLQDF